MVRVVENKVIKEKRYIDRPKIVYLWEKSTDIFPFKILPLLVYDRATVQSLVTLNSIGQIFIKLQSFTNPPAKISPTKIIVFQK